MDLFNKSGDSVCFKVLRVYVSPSTLRKSVYKAQLLIYDIKYGSNLLTVSIHFVLRSQGSLWVLPDFV